MPGYVDGLGKLDMRGDKPAFDGNCGAIAGAKAFGHGTGEREDAVWEVLGSGARVWKGQPPGDACMALAFRIQSHLLL